MTEDENVAFFELLYGAADIKCKFEFLLKSSIAYVNECEKNDDENEMSVEYLRFLNFFDNQSHLLKYKNQIEKFEKMFNYGLNNFSDEKGFSLTTTKLNPIFQPDGEEPLSALELEVVERFDILSKTNTDLVDFTTIHINEIQEDKLNWDMLKWFLQEIR